jgi:hypothetical protein
MYYMVNLMKEMVMGAYMAYQINEEDMKSGLAECNDLINNMSF